MMTKKRSTEKTVRDIRRATRRKYSAEEKIRIVIEGLCGEDSIAELCRREGINSIVYYRWFKEFMEASKNRLAGDIVREATLMSPRIPRRKRCHERSPGRTGDGKPPAQKKRDHGWGGRYTRHSATVKVEIIRLVKESSLPIRQALLQLDIGKSTFYNWLKQYQDGGIDELEDKKPSTVAE
jgi:transposase-like protein